MAETTNNIWNDDDSTEENQKPSKKRRVIHFLAFFLILAAVLVIIMLAAYRDGTGFDVIKRHLNYNDTERSGEEALYDYDASASNRFAALGDQLVVLSDTRLRILNREGGEIWSVPVNMHTPSLVQGGGMAAAYDVGGTELYVVNEKGEVMHFTADQENPLISATLNDAGYLAVTAGKKGYKGWVSVYDPQMTKMFEFNSSRRFVTDAYVADNGSCVAAVTLGEENSEFVSEVVIYDLQKANPNPDPEAEYMIRNGLVLSIGQQGNSFAAVTDTCLDFSGLDGHPVANFGYGESFLREFDICGDDFAALLLNRYRSGSAGQLVTIGTDGETLGKLDISEEVLDISACGRYLAVLYADRVVVYNDTLQEYASLRGTEYARNVIMRPDGAVLLLAPEYAKLFLS